MRAVVKTLKICFVIALGLLGAYAAYILGQLYIELPYIRDAVKQALKSIGLKEAEDWRVYLKWIIYLIPWLTGIAGFLSGFLFASHAFNNFIQFASSLEKMPPRDKVAALSGVGLGLLFVAPLSLILLNSGIPKGIALALIFALGYIFIYLGIVAMMGMRKELFSMLPGGSESLEDLVPQKCKILDTNVIIDGRIADVCRTGFVEGPIYVPGFVLDELQHIADSSDSLKRARGRRGLDILHQMQKDMRLVVRSFDLPSSEEGESVDLKLVKLAKQLNGVIITNDYNLNKVAELQGVQVLNINELANALKPVVLPGEVMNINIIKEGNQPNQGVGYLDDGTMVVVEGGKRYIGEQIDVVVTSVLQTIAGKMIFAEVKTPEVEEDYSRGPRTSPPRTYPKKPGPH